MLFDYFMAMRGLKHTPADLSSYPSCFFALSFFSPPPSLCLSIPLSRGVFRWERATIRSGCREVAKGEEGAAHVVRSDDGRARERGGGFDRIMGAEEESEGERRGVSDGGRERQGEREKERKSECGL